MIEYFIFLLYTMSMENIFGRRIKQLRMLNWYSQEEYAKILGVSRNALVKWEKGESVPSIYVANKIANSLELDLNFFVGQDLETTFKIVCADIYAYQLKKNNETYSENPVKAFEKFCNFMIEEIENCNFVSELFDNIFPTCKKTFNYLVYPQDYNKDIISEIIDNTFHTLKFSSKFNNKVNEFVYYSTRGRVEYNSKLGRAIIGETE